jgi:hypothetical protein
MFTVTAEPTQVFADGVSARLKADAPLIAMLTGVFGHLSEAARVNYPYLVLGRRTMNRDAGAMGLPGANVFLQLDGWSAYKGPYEMARVLSRVSVLLERFPIVVPGFAPVNGSLTCELSEVFEEPDEDKPGNRLYHGVQRWACEIHESI